MIRKMIASILDWMIVLKIEDDYIEGEIHRQQMVAEEERRKKQEIEDRVKKNLQGITDERLTRAEKEYNRATRIGRKIRKDADLCYATYGYHSFARSGYHNYCCYNSDSRGHKMSRCQRCGVIVEERQYEWGGRVNPPDGMTESYESLLIIGSYCDCEHCKNFVGKDAPYVLEDPPEQWVLTAFWKKGKIYPTGIRRAS